MEDFTKLPDDTESLKNEGYLCNYEGHLIFITPYEEDEILDLCCKEIELAAKDDGYENIQEYLTTECAKNKEELFNDNNFRDIIYSHININKMSIKNIDWAYNIYKKIITKELYKYINEQCIKIDDRDIIPEQRAIVVIGCLLTEFFIDDLKAEIKKRYWHD